MLVVLFVSGVICNGYNQPVSSAEGEEGADISCHCKALHSAAQNSCTAEQHSRAAQQIYLATALVSKLQGKLALMPMPSVLKCSVVVEELLHLKVHSSSFYSAQ